MEWLRSGEFLGVSRLVFRSRVTPVRREWEPDISGDGVCLEGLNWDAPKRIRFCSGLKDLEERPMLYLGVGESSVVHPPSESYARTTQTIILPGWCGNSYSPARPDFSKSSSSSWRDPPHSGWSSSKSIATKDADGLAGWVIFALAMKFLFLLWLEGGKYISTCEKVDERRHLTSGVRKKARNERVKTTKSGSDPLIGAFCTRNLDRILLSSLIARY